MDNPKLLIILFVLILFVAAFLVAGGETNPQAMWNFLKETWDIKSLLNS